MSTAPDFIHRIKEARESYLGLTATISVAQAEWKPDAESWSITEITEHLFWAEHNGLCGMYAALHDLRVGRLERTLESPHRDLTIEEIIQRTWRPKEKVPEGAGPRQGGPLSFWRQSLQGLQHILEAFGAEIKPDELRLQAFPHPISGALDFHQRLEFLRFHIDRHREQASALLRQR